jgi:dihydroorotate dehydrogenase (NAD+) catalytic subunit
MGVSTGTSPVDLSVDVGSLRLPNPVMTASGTAGHGAELQSFVALASLGAVVVKSLAAYPWPGNEAPRLHPTTAGMINAVGLQGPGIERWLEQELPELSATGARVVVSIWGRRVEEFAAAASALRGARAVSAVEINLSCPNLEGRRNIFAHDPDLSAEVVRATEVCGLPRWAKLSPNTDRIVEVAHAVHEAGAEAVTLVNTVLGLVIDSTTGRPVLGNGGGGLSGPAIRPVAVRATYDVYAAIPQLPIIGVGGIARGLHAAEFLLAGASAVQVGTAHFVDPRASAHVLAELAQWAVRADIDPLRSVIGAAHRGGLR